MRFDVPECNRCFMCIPLRYAIIIISCLNLVLDLWTLTLQSSWMIERGNGTLDLISPTLITYKGVTFHSQAWLPLLLYVLEAVSNVILIIGASMRQVKLMRLYFYYGITTLLASFVTFLVVELRIHFKYWHILGLCTTFVGLAAHAYLLLLVRSEISKPRYEVDGTHQYENHLNQQYPPNWREPDII